MKNDMALFKQSYNTERRRLPYKARKSKTNIHEKPKIINP
jgi:hypothetical protein